MVNNPAGKRRGLVGWFDEEGAVGSGDWEVLGRFESFPPSESFFLLFPFGRLPLIAR